jgi:hypothetical protein
VVHVSRHVVFDENVFPARATTSESQRLADTNAESLFEVELSQRTTDRDDQQTHNCGITEPSEVNDADSDIAENSVYDTDDEAVLKNADEIVDSDSDQSGASSGSAVVEEEDENSHSTTKTRYPSRTRRPPRHMVGFPGELQGLPPRTSTRTARRGCWTNVPLTESNRFR